MVEALRDMARGRWNRPNQGNADAGAMAVDKAVNETAASLTVQAEGTPTPPNISEKGGTVEAAYHPIEPSPGSGGTVARIGVRAGHCPNDEDACCIQAFVKSVRVAGGVVGDEEGDGGCGLVKPEGSIAGSSLLGPVFYRAAWRRTGRKMAVWKITSRCEQHSRVDSC